MLLTVASFVFTEVVADETPAVQAVLKADTKRLKLLEEEKRLQALLEKGDDTAGEKLEKVFVNCYQASGVTCGRFAQFLIRCSLLEWVGHGQNMTLYQ